MIFGIGTDICDVRRIEATLQRQGERFVRKVLSDAEVQVWQQRTACSAERGLRYLATRFSAKEAFSKAVGLGMRLPMGWRRCEIANAPSGQPVIVLHGELKQWFEDQGLKAHVSVTDETDYAASYVVVERVTVAGGPVSDRPPSATVTSPVAPEMEHSPIPLPVPAPVAPAVPEAPAAAQAQRTPQAPITPAPVVPDDRSILGRFGGRL